MGKIQTVDEMPCKHEARMIYISGITVKETLTGMVNVPHMIMDSLCPFPLSSSPPVGERGDV
jgi:hypothetical protein